MLVTVRISGLTNYVECTETVKKQCVKAHSVCNVGMNYFGFVAACPHDCSMYTVFIDQLHKACVGQFFDCRF